MRTNTRAGLPAFPSSFVRPIVPLIIAMCGLPVFAADQPAAPEPKTHALFMGADISVQQNKTLYRVINIESSAFVIKVDGREVRVPADWANVVLKVDRTLKLTDAIASVTNYKGERAYTLANDPTVQFQRGLAAAELSYSDSVYAQTLAEGMLHNTENTVARMNHLPAGSRGAGDGAALLGAQMIANAQANVVKAAAAPGSNFYNYKGSVLATGVGMFDAMEFSFEVSAAHSLDNPYVVILARYRENEWKPGQFSNWVYAQPLQPITSESRKIHILRGGFPPGFEIQDVQVHLYSRGREIATDIAPKRVALTREEAFTYARMEYLSGHKGATLPANAFMGKLTPEAKALISADQYDQAYYVKVSKDGVPAAAFFDTNCSRKVDGTVADLIENVRFYPALENGKAVDGIAELKFFRLSL